MKITKQQLKQIIREELENVLEEQRPGVRQDSSGLMQPRYDDEDEEQLSADDFRSEYGYDRDSPYDDDDPGTYPGDISQADSEVARSYIRRHDYAEKMKAKHKSDLADIAAAGANKSRFIPDADLPDSAVPQGAKRKLARAKALKK